MPRLPSSRISPTAHYTGHVWLRHGLSHPAFETSTGTFLFNAARPVNRLSSLVGGSTLEAMLLARHRVIDASLEKAIASGEVTQVLEVAAGLSPRGYRFTKRYPHVTYLEADLPEMAEHKRSVLSDVRSLGPRHRVVEIDALAESGEMSVEKIASRELDPACGVAIITEGLLSYFPIDSVCGMWGRFARTLTRFSAGLYLSDLHVDDDMNQIRGARLFRRLLNQWTRGKHHTYFGDGDAASAALGAAGFAEVALPYASDFAAQYDLATREQTGRVRVIIARVAIAMPVPRVRANKQEAG